MGVPSIDVGPLVRDEPGADAVSNAIDEACREVGFFTITGHGVDVTLQQRLAHGAETFFARPDAEKAEYAMARAGKAWRGWFPVGGELTSGVPDRKEGLYIGTEDPAADPRPLHGPNLLPTELHAVVLEYLEHLTTLGHQLMSGIARGLGIDADWFAQHLTADPVVLFRIFHYPPEPGPASDGWGVGEHTDYGLLTILRQDLTGGLQVRDRGGAWVDVEPVPDSFVCNIGDMLERMTGGRYRSTPHRVRNTSGHSRYSFPFFFDPSWDAVIQPLPLGADAGPAPERWDGTSVFEFDGSYGEYLSAKVAKVFPELFRDAVN